MKKLITLIIAVVLVGSLVGCKTETPVVAGNYPGTPGKDSVTINLGSEPPKLNSILTTDVVSFNVLRHVMEGLTTTDKSGKTIPAIAKSWDVSADGTVYTFHLRNDAKWSNGAGVTANDFAFAWRQVLEPKNAAEYNYLLFLIKNAEEFNADKAIWEDVGIKVINDYELEVTLLSAAAYFPSMLNFGVFMPVLESAYTGDAYATEKDNMLYNGPYVITVWDHEDKIVLEKNPNYVGDTKVAIDKIIFEMIADSNTAVNAFENGELDMCGLRGEMVEKLRDNKAKVAQYSDGSSWAIAFNQTRTLLKNKNLRKALTLAINRQAYITDIRKDHSVPSFYWTSPDVKQNGKSLAAELGEGKWADHDVEGAKAALELAKQELNVKDIKLELLTDEGDVARDIATFFQSCFEEIGVKIDVVQVPFKDRLERQHRKDYDLSIYGWGPDYDDPMTFLDIWMTNAGNNITGFSNEKFDENIRKAIIETDEKARMQLFVECENILADDFALGYIYFRMRDYVTSDKLDGVVRTSLQDFNLLFATIK